MMGGLYSDEAIIETCGIRIYTNHFAPHAQNKAGGLENRLKMLAAAEDTYGKVHGLYNAHNHKFSCVMTKSHFGVLTPGWQHKTPYAIQKNLITPSDIGYVNLIVEDEELITIDKRGVKTSPFGCEVLKW
jgi:hypothetical protein